MSIEAASDADGSGRIHHLATENEHCDQDETVESGVAQGNTDHEVYYKHPFFTDCTCLTSHARRNANSRQWYWLLI